MRKLLELLLFCLCLPVWSEEAKPALVVTETKCRDWNRLDFPDFYVENNVWGKRNLKGYKQCVFRGVTPDGSFGWEWAWPEGSPDVVAFPEVCFGWKPWSDRSSTDQLPIQISKVRTALATYDVSMKADGVFNLSFDAWVTSAPRPTEKNITAEIMIWLDHTTLQPDGKSPGTITIDGEEYLFFKGKPPHAAWPYLAFIKTTPRISGKTDLKKFLDFLVIGKHISDKDYLVNVEFGNEVKSGTGKTEVRKYKVDIGKR